jgi:uncharacterized protein YjbJ (UPF0337 family)
MEDKNLTERGLDNSLEGKTTDLKGKLKDGLGGLTGDTSLQGEGKLDQLKGKVQDALGKVQREVDKP